MKKAIGYVVKVKKMWENEYDYYFFEKLSLAKESADVYMKYSETTICELYVDCENGKMSIEPMDY